ncbi:MAG: HNH endonuclease, partial [Micrococcales bacterium]
DRNFMGISPDFVVKINRALLEEVDGPMLKHGLQEMHDSRIQLPTRDAEKPNRDFLRNRFDEFLTAKP